MPRTVPEIPRSGFQARGEQQPDRCAGHGLRRREGLGELPSEGMVLGAVQVPPDGMPVVFLADHPTTGGYPVVGVVPEADLAAAAQAVPGTPVRLLLTARLEA